MAKKKKKKLDYLKIVRMTQARQLYNGGSSIKEIAQAMGEKESTIREWLIKTGVRLEGKKEGEGYA